METQSDNNEWIYFVLTTNRVTVLCKGKEKIEVVLTGIGKLGINTGCKGYSTSALLQASVMLKVNSSLKGEDVLSQIPLQFGRIIDLYHTAVVNSVARRPACRRCNEPGSHFKGAHMNEVSRYYSSHRLQ
jgi:hypothetical protein